MHTAHCEEHTVNEILNEIPEAGHVLRDYHFIDTKNHRLSIAEAAHTVSTTPDEMLAVMEYRLRRAAKHE